MESVIIENNSVEAHNLEAVLKAFAAAKGNEIVSHDKEFDSVFLQFSLNTVNVGFAKALTTAEVAELKELVGAKAVAHTKQFDMHEGERFGNRVVENDEITYMLVYPDNFVVYDKNL